MVVIWLCGVCVIIFVCIRNGLYIFLIVVVFFLIVIVSVDIFIGLLLKLWVSVESIVWFSWFRFSLLML